MNVKIQSGTKLHSAITKAAASFDLNPSAFATGMLYAAIEKKLTNALPQTQKKES